MAPESMATETETTGYDEYLSAPLLSPGYGPPPAGVIRPGIMVLKRGCTQEDEKIYGDGIARGYTWDEIDKRLGPDAQQKSKLTPRNVDFFTVREDDVIDPAWARAIKEQYADPQGNIRKLPVWFSSNEWWNIIPHSLKCWSAGGLRYWSTFKTVRNLEDGQPDRKRVCEYFLDGPDRKRVFGGRDRGERPCDPDNCREYQRKECKFSGSILFYMPGVPGGPWLIPTTSWYSINAIYAALKEMKEITHGRVAKLWIKGKAVFQLRKVKDTVSHINGGQPERKDQYLIYLEPTVDLMELASEYEDKKVMARGTTAATLLSRSAPEVAEEIEKRPEEECPGEEEVAAEEDQVMPGEAGAKSAPAGTEESTQQPPASANNAQTPKDEDSVKPEQAKAICDLASRYGISEQRVREVMQAVHGREEAGTIIKQLSKGDTSRFLRKQPATGGAEERY